MMPRVVKSKGLIAIAPSGMKFVDNGVPKPLDAATIRLMLKGWEIVKQIDSLMEALDEINRRLIEAHGDGCELAVTDVCRVIIDASESAKITDVERLKAVLGPRFADLVKAEACYRPEQKLIEMACDGDEPLQPAIRECISIVKSEDVTWKGAR
jgi:hypothetical protein